MLIGLSLDVFCGVLPEDRADVLYHSYDGGGVQIEGPSVLVRRHLGKNLSFFGNYYVDAVSSASIDVVTTASPYTEERTQISGGADFLVDDVTMSASYTKSEENDYIANTASYGFSHDFFGDLTTVSFGYSQGWDTVKRRGDDLFSADVTRRQYRFGISQVLTKNSYIDLGLETITDEGYLHNPYRSVRYLTSTNTVARQPEVYPNTHSSNAFAARGMYYLPFRSSIHGGWRIYNDTWGIEAFDVTAGYTWPVESWIFDFGYRYYSQGHADFYSDLFPRADYLNYLARDKELSTFSSHDLTAAITYNFLKHDWWFITKASISFSYDYIYYSYEDFRDTSAQGYDPGDEPLYSFDAGIIQLYLSIWY